MAPETREGLLERSRRFLSSSRRTPTQPDSQQSSADKGDSSLEQSAYQRRRNQVRRAQRSHRERKENYIKGLEQEILDLREHGGSKVQEHEARIAYLKNVLSSHGIHLPEQWEIDAMTNTSFNVSQRFATASFVQHGDPSGYIQITRPNTAGDQSSPYSVDSFGNSTQQASYEGVSYTPTSNNHLHPTNEHSDNTQDPSSHGVGLSLQINNLSISSSTVPHANTDQNALVSMRNDILDAGIDFVLTLEYPCMVHVSPIAPSTCPQQNHALTASHRLLLHAPEGFTPKSTWQVPEAIIQNLLVLTSEFDLNGEITPVQAWNKLRNHPKFGLVTRMDLLRLKQALTQEVKCFGFGAVMESAVFDIALEELYAKL